MPARPAARRRAGPGRRAATAALAALVAGALGAPARAGEFWRHSSAPSADASNYDVAMRVADGFAERAAAHSMRNPRRAKRLARSAVGAYERAIEAEPDRPTPHYRAAEVLYAHFIRDDDVPDRELSERAIAHWSRFEELAPLDPRVRTMLDRRSLTHTKLADAEHLERALEDYRSLLRLTDAGSTSAEAMGTWLSNRAEILMMLGRTGEAVETYARSLEYQDRPLYAYGMAVALDRDGQGVKAREVFRAYAASDGLRDLKRAGVFFVPRGEIHYYLGLGHEAIGDTERALRHFRRYLDSGAHPQFHDRARQHVGDLERRARREQRDG